MEGNGVASTVTKHLKDTIITAFTNGTASFVYMESEKQWIKLEVVHQNDRGQTF